MFTKIITIVVLWHNLVNCNYLEEAANYQEPKIERNNIVNKGVWVRNKLKDNLYEKGRVGAFIFRENSLDVDNLLQNNFDAFGANDLQDSPVVSAYVKRNKRSSRVEQEQRPRTGILKTCNGKGCKNGNLENKLAPAGTSKPQLPNDIGTASVFNDYPYEVAILLNKSESNTPNNDTQSFENDIENSIHNLSTDKIRKNDVSVSEDLKNGTKYKTISSPKRSMKYDFETETIKKFEFTEDVNKTAENKDNNENKVMDRNIFDKENTVWHQNAPIPDINMYKVVPKEPLRKSKPVTERGLIKVISMLTKTFKKIIKQHHEIKEIHSKMSDVNDEFVKNAATITNKFRDFDLKYLYLIKFHEKLKSFDAKLASKQEYFKTKEREMARNFKEFENQQKKFLQQQRQFYNIQKLMLAQNEKINFKQNLIAKTQSEISHRQNNFARILKKAKQLYVESKNPSITKLTSGLPKMNHQPKTEPDTLTSTTSPSTESVKINLFSIPTSNKIENQDDLIIKEKDEQPIDDLVYKYFFNNTFIDTLMKNNVLTSFIGNPDFSDHSRNVKNKRNELETTILLPVFEINDSESYVDKNRERRWINHHSRHKSKRRNRGKGAIVTIVNATDKKIAPLRRKKIFSTISSSVPKNNGKNNISVESNPAPKPKDTAKDTKPKDDPFLNMAKNFCIEIHQNLNPQMLRWCIEKALRRLQFLDVTDMKMLPTSAPTTTTSPAKLLNIPSNTKANKVISEYTNLNIVPDKFVVQTIPSTASTTVVTETTATPSVQTSSTQATTNISTSSTTVGQISAAFFPGNEELESNLQQFDLKPDTEGNVYYEGSIHASEILDSESQGMDDIMPGLESNSNVDMDPLAFDLQAQRRAFVRQLNEKIKISLG